MNTVRSIFRWSALASTLALLLDPAAYSQCYVAEIHAPQAEEFELFGSEVAIDGGLVLSGAWLQDHAEPTNISCNSGGVHVFSGSGANWVHEALLVPSDAACQAYFGAALDLHGTTAVVGAYNAPGVNGERTGRAYVFERAGPAWVETSALRALDADPNDGFGSTVAVHGDFVAVASPGFDQLEHENAGAVYLFERSGPEWIYHATLLDPFYEDNADFGASIVISDRHLLIGAPGEREQGTEAGAVYAYELIGGAWQYRQKLVATDGTWNRRFGTSMSLAGARVLIGAPKSPSWHHQLGRAYLFEFAAGSGWVEHSRYLPPDQVEGALFGQSLAMGQEHFVIGAPFLDSLTGAGYLYGKEAIGAWSFRSKLRSRDQEFGDFEFVDLAISGPVGSETIVVGASADDAFGMQSGSVYVMQPAPFATQFCACAPVSPCGNFDVLEGCVNSTGDAARLMACGSASVAQDDLRVVVDGLPVGTPLLLVVGASGAASPFADGVKCLRAPYGRFPVLLSGGDGSAEYGPGLGAFAAGSFPGVLQFVAGGTVAMQAWYRDASGPCGTGGNWSSGMVVEFSL
ncbi:MAG: hypothetical protein ACI841_001570 [Planctomycetota bacterium]|jgi:hypothetical protein